MKKWVLLALFLLVSSSANASVRDVALDEIKHIESQGFTMPTYALVTVDPFRVLGYTVITTREVRYVIVLRPFYLIDGQAEFVAGHEAYHVLADAYGWTQDEDQADKFAACYGSVAAKRYADYEGVVCRAQRRLKTYPL